MTDPLVGGLRDRLIRDSLWQLVTDTLTQIGWLSPTVHDVIPGTRQHQPVHLAKTIDPLNTAIVPNTIGLDIPAIDYDDLELGDNATTGSHHFAVDIFAENEAVGRELRGDLRSAFVGLYPSIGRTWPTLDVYDYTQTTPDVLFTCLIEQVVVDRANGYDDHRKYWFTVEGVIVDDGGT